MQTPSASEKDLLFFLMAPSQINLTRYAGHAILLLVAEMQDQQATFEIDIF
jgi:indole-3-glycerol phosphate synthase